ncbi:hypothetical protein [Mucilaginibacter jinjuensis]|uniref:Uncharacterized protein n=1 Tax=Mucilaginibacter jinjuensis TaxID=1176721 RepID=A0ABY7TAL4_9SPHI|nr:hypothetical protein [Mucilaginibacter jinjuensis]WCT13353.1 hypothetical protein PQO05_05325 [Mucilaginibacter jinjuensis]
MGGIWPESGFSLPPTLNNKPLEGGKKYVLSEALIVFSEEVRADEATMVRQYLDLTAAVYLNLPKPDTNYQDWPDILQKGYTNSYFGTLCLPRTDATE